MRKKRTTKSTPFLIAIAAFAVTASGVHAFGSTELLTKAGLTDEQVVAVQEAQELKASGEIDAAKATLEAAGINRETMQAIKAAAREAKQAVRDAVEAGDWSAFQVAVADSPLAEYITSEADFDQFREAHELRQAGERDEAKSLLEDLGINADKFGKGKRGKGPKSPLFEQLTDDQREALQVAREANDREAVRAILEEAGIERPERGHRAR